MNGDLDEIKYFYRELTNPGKTVIFALNNVDILILDVTDKVAVLNFFKTNTTK